MKIITASEARIIAGRQNRTKIEDFNEKIRNAIADKCNNIFIKMADTTPNFISRLKRAGYDVFKSTANNWLITWKGKNEPYLNKWDK